MRIRLRLDQNIQAGNDLVGDQQPGLGAERARDVDALTLAAAQLRRKRGAEFLRQPGSAEERDGAGGVALGAAVPVALGLQAIGVTRLATRRRGLRAEAGSWKIICTARMRAAQKSRGWVTSAPSSRMRPTLGASIP